MVRFPQRAAAFPAPAAAPPQPAVGQQQPPQPPAEPGREYAIELSHPMFTRPTAFIGVELKKEAFENNGVNEEYTLLTLGLKTAGKARHEFVSFAVPGDWRPGKSRATETAEDRAVGFADQYLAEYKQKVLDEVGQAHLDELVALEDAHKDATEQLKRDVADLNEQLAAEQRKVSALGDTDTADRLQVDVNSLGVQAERMKSEKEHLELQVLELKAAMELQKKENVELQKQRTCIAVACSYTAFTTSRANGLVCSGKHGDPGRECCCTYGGGWREHCHVVGGRSLHRWTRSRVRSRHFWGSVSSCDFRDAPSPGVACPRCCSCSH